MIPILTVLVTLVLALVVTRTASVALTLTGLSSDVARFQARSAFTGVGYTTPESELITRHPVRRRIVSVLMLLGNVGLVTVVASVISTFVGPAGAGAGTNRLLLLAGGLMALVLVARSRLLDRWMCATIERALRRFTDLDTRDYADLLRLGAGYRVAEVAIEAGDWMAGRPLAELDLSARGILVLGLRRAGGEYEGAPAPDARVEPGDTLVVYGAEPRIRKVCGKAST